ncbi:RNA polymerase III subunit C82 [Massospora cicadina]|nr:RNA polymerase III subunit C82 [Massospora cicadina]
MSVTATNQLWNARTASLLCDRKVATLLLLRGRLPLGLLFELCTTVPRKQIRESLFILLQHNLVTYADVPEGPRFVTYYSLEQQNILDRANLLGILSLAKERYGNAENPAASEPKQAMRLTMEHIRAALLKMIQTRFVSANLAKDMITKKDQDLDDDAKLIKSLGNLSTDLAIKKAKAARDRARACEPKDTPILGINRGLANDDHNSFGKKRLAGMDIVESVDYAAAKINQGAGETLRAFVATVEPKITGFNAAASPAASGMDIQGNVDTNVRLETFIHLSGTEPNGGHKPNTLFLLNEFMKVLSQDDANFLSRADDRTLGQYHMDYAQIRISFGLRILEQIIKRNLVLPAGACSEFSFSTIFLTCAAFQGGHPTGWGCQSKVQELAVHGLVEIQEVPALLSVPPPVAQILTFCRWALGSLMKRRRYEVSSRADVKANQDILSSYDKKELEKLNRILAYLDTSHQRIANMIVVLE